MMRSFFLSFLFVTLLSLGSVSGLYAGKLEKAFEALKVYNYFEAKSLFEKSLKSEPSGASYGLSLIYSSDKNPFFQLDSALYYIEKVEKSFPEEKEKVKESLKLFGIDQWAIEEQKALIGDLAFTRAKTGNSIASYNHFIDHFSFAKGLGLALQSRDSIAFSEAKKIDNSEAYLEFMRNYNKSNQYDEASHLYDLRLFQEKTATGDIEDFDKFIRQNPHNAYVSQAMDSVFVLFIKENTVENYYAFIKNYPENKNVSQAWRTLYKLYNKDYSKERIVEFRIDFPDYPFQDEVMVDYELSDIIYLPIKEHGKWGFINDSGHIMIKPEYDWVEDFHEGLAMVGKNFKVGFINKAGKLVVPLEYDEAEKFYQGLAIVSIDNAYGVINKAGLVEVPLVYDDLNEFNLGLASVQVGEKYGYLDVYGRLVIGPQFDFAGDFENGFAYVMKDGLYGIINSEGREIVPIEFDWLENFYQGLARVRIDYKFAMYNKLGNKVIPMNFDHLGQPSDGRILAVIGEEYGYYDMVGNEKINLELEFSTEVLDWGNFENGVVKIKRHKLAGLIDSTGKKLLPAIFEDLKPYYDELIPVKKKGKWGFCDKDVKLKIGYSYDDVNPFIDGLAIAALDGLYGIIDKEDNMVVPFYYEEITYLESGLILVKKDGTFGLIDKFNRKLVEAQFDKITEHEGPFIQLEKEDEMSWFNPKTEQIFWRSHAIRQ